MAIRLADLKLVSSNKNKLKEYHAFGIADLECEAGVDLPEVDGTPDQVILHKAIAAGNGRIVEDSILVVDGQAFVDARWRLKRVSEWFGKPGIWEVRMGVNQGGVVRIYKGAISGVFGPATGIGHDYDPYFHLPELGFSLAELSQTGRKVEYSARKRAIDALIANEVHGSFDIASVADWTGQYQH